MILDADGNKIEVGNIIHAMIGTSWIKMRVNEIKEGGMRIQVNPTQQGVTPDKLILQLELQCTDAPPGMRHPALLRLINPEKEVVVPVNKVTV